MAVDRIYKSADNSKEKMGEIEAFAKHCDLVHITSLEPGTPKVRLPFRSAFKPTTDSGKATVQFPKRSGGVTLAYVRDRLVSAGRQQ